MSKEVLTILMPYDAAATANMRADFDDKEIEECRACGFKVHKLTFEDFGLVTIEGRRFWKSVYEVTRAKDVQ